MRKLTGVVQQHLRDLTVRENMELHTRLHHLKPSERRQRITELLHYVELAKQANQIVGELSGGMKRRLMIARALIHRPKLLFLDIIPLSHSSQCLRAVTLGQPFPRLSLLAIVGFGLAFFPGCVLVLRRASA